MFKRFGIRNLVFFLQKKNIGFEPTGSTIPVPGFMPVLSSSSGSKRPNTVKLEKRFLHIDRAVVGGGWRSNLSDRPARSGSNNIGLNG